MKRLVLLLMLGIILSGCAQQSMPQNQTGAATAPISNKIVTIKGFAFNPQEAIVNMGMTVSWVNEDSVAHSVKFSDGMQSPVLAPGDNFSRTFDTSGVFNYTCGIHPSMTGDVKVLGTEG